MKKIVFLDIDGTLVTPNYPLSDFVKKGIKKAREKYGIKWRKDASKPEKTQSGR